MLSTQTLSANGKYNKSVCAGEEKKAFFQMDVWLLKTKSTEKKPSGNNISTLFNSGHTGSSNMLLMGHLNNYLNSTVTTGLLHTALWLDFLPHSTLSWASAIRCRVMNYLRTIELNI